MDPTSAQISSESPILRLIPYINASFSVLKSALGLAPRALRVVRNLSPLPIVLYLLAPVLVFLDIATTVFLRAPYRTVVYLLEAIYPLYVFIGVACITGGILGLAARVLSRVIVVSLQYSPPAASLNHAPRAKNEADAAAGADLRRGAKRTDRVKTDSDS